MTNFSISRWIVVCIHISTCLTDLSFEDQSTIQSDFHIFRSASRMNSILIVILQYQIKTRLFPRLVLYPYSNHCNLDRFFKCDINKMISTECKWCQPHMNIISCSIHSINQITNHTRIMSVFRKNIDISWICCDLRTEET